MSMQDYEEAARLIDLYGDGDFDGRKPEGLVQQAEAALSVAFPPTYRRFLLEFGCGDIRGEEFYGVIDGNFETSSVPNGVWLTLDERRSHRLPEKFIIVYAGGDGSYVSIDTSQKNSEGENPIVRLTPSNTVDEYVASSFGEFLKNTVSAAA